MNYEEAIKRKESLGYESITLKDLEHRIIIAPNLPQDTNQFLKVYTWAPKLLETMSVKDFSSDGLFSLLAVNIDYPPFIWIQSV